MKKEGLFITILGSIIFLYVMWNFFYKEQYRWPVPIPGHRPSLGDFLPVIGEEPSGSGGYMNENDI